MRSGATPVDAQVAERLPLPLVRPGKRPPPAGSVAALVHGEHAPEGAPPMQAPAMQTSSVVQTLPSLQGPALSAWTHPSTGSQRSSLQTFPSSQPNGHVSWAAATGAQSKTRKTRSIRRIAWYAS